MLKASVIGNIGNDPELKYSASGSAILRFNVASNYRTKVESGEWQDRTEWIRVALFGQRAERLMEHLRKGMRVYVDGRLEARPWNHQERGPQAGLELMANDVEFASARRDEDAAGPVRASVTDERRRAVLGDDDDSDLPF